MEELGSLSNNDAIRLLKDELAKRKQRNAGYSLRAFAQSLKISPAQLSQLISGKRNFTSKTLQQISKSLHLSPEEENNLHRQVLIPAKAHAEQKDKRQLQEDEFKVIAEWYHFAILSLSKVRG
ncbi:MAG TPA: helix-turn-helix domain-containing protein, partial [Bdellovibrio sp.]|uniref:helix-turn-helix domain-containing protein n=1 Tax=Bdellovibrio sp. TaxID=28201 RepID=UPI002EFA0C10